MSEQMEFPETFDEFAKEYGFKDRKEIYTNGADLIPVFRVKQWLEQDNKLRRIETDTAYECGKHANQWIPVTERFPEDGKTVMVTVNDGVLYPEARFSKEDGWEWAYESGADYWVSLTGVKAWMPLPEPYKEERQKLKDADQSGLEYADMPTV